MKDAIKEILTHKTFTDDEIAFLADHVNLVIEITEEN